MISHDQYPEFRLSRLGIASLLSLLFLISPLSSQNGSPPSPDFNGNGIVDFPDFLLFANAFGSQAGQEKYESKYDLDGDGEIGFPDFILFAIAFGQTVNTSPDLVVASMTASHSPSVDMEQPFAFTLDATVENKGNGPSAATTLRYYRSTDTTFSASDTQVGTGAVNGLETSATSNERIDLTTQPSEGTYYIVCVDAVSGESNTENNCHSIQVGAAPTPPPPTPQLTITANTASVTEGTAATFTITASSSPATALTVNVDVSETGNVISGTPPSTVTINANATTATLTVNTVNDQADESNSVVTAKLQGGTGYTVGSSSSASVTVNDNDVPEITISAGTSPVTEGTAATFTITASSAPTSALTVKVNVTETEDVISGTPASTVIINANATTATLTVNTVNDQRDEPNSVVTAKLQGSTGYTVGSSSSASVTVEDNDSPPRLPPPPPPTPQVIITASSTTITEGTAATFTITASSAPTSALTVNVDVSEDGDVISGTPSSTVTIDANKTTVTLTVNTVNDQRNESNSVVTATLESGTGYTVGASSSVSVTVNDNDIPEVTISAGTTPVTEGTSATFMITASPAPATALTVNVDVSETANVISGTPSSTMTIDADETTATLTVNTVNDQRDEPNSVITAELETGTSYTVGASSSASVRVNDNDDPPPGTPEVTISAGTTPVTEGTAATFTITVSPAQTTALTVNVKVTEDGDVISGTPSSTVTIDADETTATLTVNTVNDEGDESNSVVTAKLQGGTGYTVGSSSSASVTVNDNDVPEVTISAGTTPVTEGTAATFTITASSAPTSALTVNVNVSEDGDVISGTPSSTVTVNANATTATLTINTEDDGADESNSVVTAEVETGTGYTVGSTSSASVAVEDNDNPPPPSTPDLVVESPSVSNSRPVAGASFTLSAEVSNTGDGRSPATTLRYYRSTDATIATSDTAVGTDVVGALAASGTSAQSISLTATAGTYYYGACVDEVTDESDTTNNCSGSVSVTVVVQETQPDLTVTLSITPPSGGIFHVGSSFRFGATVRNAGDGASTATTLRYYQSKDAPIRTPDTEIRTDAVGALAAPGVSAESISLTAPSTAGTYYYNACVDAVAGESNTTNNCSFVSIGVTVVPEADLVVGSPSVTDSSPETGDSFTLSATVGNDGDGAAAATTLRYYRSTDGTITTSDTEEGTDAMRGLSAGATRSESISLTAPATAGTYYYGACVDTVTGESDTTNNCSASVQVDVE